MPARSRFCNGGQKEVDNHNFLCYRCRQSDGGDSRKGSIMAETTVEALHHVLSEEGETDEVLQKALKAGRVKYTADDGNTYTVTGTRYVPPKPTYGLYVREAAGFIQTVPGSARLAIE